MSKSIKFTEWTKRLQIRYKKMKHCHLPIKCNYDVENGSIYKYRSFKI